MSPRPSESFGWMEEAKRLAKKHARAAVGALSLAAVEPGCEPKPPETPAAETSAAEPDIAAPADAEAFVLRPNGEYSPEERAERTLRLANGAELFDDAGVYFYRVRSGDTLSEISQQLAEVPRFSYLKGRGYGIAAYNADPRRLRPGMWLPIPRERDADVITDQKFLASAERAVDRLSTHSLYGERMRALLRHTSKDELITSMLAIADVESGGTQLGELALVRYEPSHDAFSYSLFHILMKQAGLRARKNLGLTEGQLYRPENGAALFLAFLFEKDVPESVFPIGEHAEAFSAFYNGAKWKNYNPNYADDLREAYARAHQLVSRTTRRTK